MNKLLVVIKIKVTIITYKSQIFDMAVKHMHPFNTRL